MTLGWSIKKDHDMYRVIFSKLFHSKESDSALREKLFKEYLHNLFAHHEAEERILFPEMIKKKKEEWKDLALELEMEHRAMKILIKELSEMGYASKVWRYRLSPLYSIMRIHWDKEEQFLIPFALEYFTADEWEAIGKAFDASMLEWLAKPMK
ncbi:MAG: hemerythrin domain-containing protein [Methanomassiliicoccales archaeon]|nr:hemerythrin domain-containing protein [Methanomassiliicoccales archaeon]